MLMDVALDEQQQQEEWIEAKRKKKRMNIIDRIR